MAVAQTAPLQVRDDPAGWYELGEFSRTEFGPGQIVLMRKDPPVDAEYIYDTQVLDVAAAAGACVVNNPQGLRDYNEAGSPAVPAVLPADPGQPRCQGAEGLRPRTRPGRAEAAGRHGHRSIFRSGQGDPNLNVILETLTDGTASWRWPRSSFPTSAPATSASCWSTANRSITAWRAFPRVTSSAATHTGRGEGRPLSERDRWIAGQVGPEMKRRGMRFVGLDVIGDYLTEVNVTSPTCVRELDAQYGLNIAGTLFDALEAGLR